MPTPLTERFRFFSPVQTEKPFHVIGFTGVEGLHRLFDFHIDLVCADAAVDTGKLLAAPCRFEVLRDDDAAPAVFSGYPAQVEQRGFFNGYAYYAVHLRPTFWKLSGIRQSAVFLDKKLEDVLRELMTSQPFFQFPHEFRLMARDYPKPEFAMQYQESLYDYMCWRMEEQGAYFYFEEKNGADTVVFADAPQSHSVENAPRLAYSPVSGLEGERREEVVVSFSLAQTPLPRRVVLRSYDWRNPNTPVVGMADVDADGLGDVYLSNEYVDNDADAARLATIRAQELRCRSRLFHGTSSAPTLRPGRIFRLDRHYNDAFNRDYLVTEITHEGRQDAYLSLGLGIPLRDAGEHLYYRNTFTCMEADVPYRPARTAPRNRISGVLRAFVAGDGSGARAETDQYGRYKLTFPFDISDRTGGNASCWIRRAQPQVGKDSGLSLPLQPGTEVLVSFVDGNPDLPVIAGALANGETGSISNAGNTNIQGLRTAGGNQITINDTDTRQGISLSTATGGGLTVAAGSTESSLLHSAHLSQVAGSGSAQLASFGLSQFSGFKVSSGAFRFDKNAYWPALCASLSDYGSAITNTLSSQQDDASTKNELDWSTAGTKSLTTILNAIGSLAVGLNTAPIPYGGAMVAEDDMAKTLMQVSPGWGDMISAAVPYFAGRLTSLVTDSVTVGTTVKAADPKIAYMGALEAAMDELYESDQTAYKKYSDNKSDYLAQACAAYDEVNQDLSNAMASASKDTAATLKERQDELHRSWSAHCQNNEDDLAYYKQKKHESGRSYMVSTLAALLPEIISQVLFYKGFNPKKKLGGILLRARDRNITMTAQDAVAMHAQRGILRNTRDLPEAEILSPPAKKKNPSGDTESALGELRAFAPGEKADTLGVLEPYEDNTPGKNLKPTRAGMDAAAYWGVKINQGKHATDFMRQDLDGIRWNLKDDEKTGKHIRKRATFIADTTELHYMRNRWSCQHSEEDARISGDAKLFLGSGPSSVILYGKQRPDVPRGIFLNTTADNAMITLRTKTDYALEKFMDITQTPLQLELACRASNNLPLTSLILKENLGFLYTGSSGSLCDENRAVLGTKQSFVACVKDEVRIRAKSICVGDIQLSGSEIKGTASGIFSLGNNAIKICGCSAPVSSENAFQAIEDADDAARQAHQDSHADDAAAMAHEEATGDAS